MPLSLDVNNLFGDPDSRLYVYLDTGKGQYSYKKFQFILLAQVNVGCTAVYQARRPGAFMSAANTAFQTGTDWWNRAGGILRGVKNTFQTVQMLTDLMGVSQKIDRMSAPSIGVASEPNAIKKYVESGDFRLDFQVLLVNYNGELDILGIEKELVAYTLPKRLDPQQLVNAIATPLEVETGFSTGDPRFIKGTWGIEIGRWFKIPPGVMVLEGANFVNSLETIYLEGNVGKSGTPLYILGDIRFVSAKMIFGDDVRSWMVGAKS